VWQVQCVRVCVVGRKGCGMCGGGVVGVCRCVACVGGGGEWGT